MHEHFMLFFQIHIVVVIHLPRKQQGLQSKGAGSLTASLAPHCSAQSPVNNLFIWLSYMAVKILTEVSAEVALPSLFI